MADFYLRRSSAKWGVGKMVGLIESLEAAKKISEVVSALSSAGSEVRQQADKSQARRFVRYLRAIYFTPRGTLNVLTKLSEGIEPDTADLANTLADFNDAEWEVERITSRMQFDENYTGGLSLRVRRTLQEISWGKIDLRRRLQQELNEPLTFGRGVDPGRAHVLLKKLQDLNLKIEALEEEFL